MLLKKGKKGMWGWLTRHPLLAMLSVVFIALLIAVAVAMIISTSPAPVESTASEKKRPKHPTIAGAAVHMPAIITPAPALTLSDPVSRWKLLLFQALMTAVGVLFSVYLVHLLINNF